MGGKDCEMNVFENEEEARDYVENTYGFVVDNLKKLTEFNWVGAELPIAPFMVKRHGRFGYSKCISIAFMVKGDYTEAKLGFEE